MTRLPRVDFARRFFERHPIRPAASPAAVAIGWAWRFPQVPPSPRTPPRDRADHIKAVTSAVDGASIKANTATSNDWPTIGLDYAETRFSKLNQINTDNVKNLGLVWTYSLESSRGVEATPLVVDGIMYVTASWSVVHAVDARTGKRIWTFDPGSRSREGLQGLLRRRQSRRRALEGQGLRRRL